MFRSWYRNRVNLPQRRPQRGGRRRVFLQTEVLEDRCVPAGTLSGVGFTSLNPQPTEGQAFTGQVATVFDDGPLNPAFTVSINWGDGTALDTTGTLTPIPGSPHAFAVNGTHTFAEESSTVTPPFNFPVTVTVSDAANGLAAVTIASQASVVDANLSQGNPVTEAPSQRFAAAGTAPSTAALQSFEAAIGGVNNKATPAPQNGGFRTITWDGVKTDGTDAAAGPNSTLVAGPQTVGIPLDRFQTNGVYFGAIYAVSSDRNAQGQQVGSFSDVNPSVGGATPLFDSFSHNNTFAMLNDNGIDFKFVAPSTDNSTIVAASSDGFGAIFINVEIPNTKSIQYFNGNNLLDTEFAPVGGKGQPVFVGALFPRVNGQPVVTRVVLTLGTDVLFTFDGTTAKPGPVADDGVTHNLVVTDDWAFPEPVPTPNGLPIVTGAQGTNHAALLPATGTVGVPLTTVVASFNDQDPAANAKDFTASINWGDGHLTNGIITANAHGGFDVSGTNTYAHAGQFPINVDVADLGGGNGIAGSIPTVSINNTLQVQAGGSTTTLTVSPGSAAFGQPVMLTATVMGAGGATPTGTVTFFSNGQSLGTVGLNAGGKAVLTVSTLVPGSDNVTAVYSGDTSFTTSTSTPASVTVSPDVTSLFSVSIARSHRHHGHRNRLVVTLRNQTGNLIPAPLLLVLDNLTAGAQLIDASGTTHVLPPLGDPFVTVDLGGASAVAPGGSVRVNLDFAGRAARAVQFTARVIAGTMQV
jgi:hypothetical protein